MSRKVRLYSVDSIQLTQTKSIPPRLMVTAFGMAATTGWNDIALDPLETELSPDRILDLAFVGVPPSGIVLPMLTPAIAHFVWEGDADEVIGVVVHARTNQLTQLLRSPGIGAAEQQRGGFTTQALGEEGPPPGGHFTTLAIGEEHPHPTTLSIGEEGPHTTLALGEEHGPTTLVAGEEGPTGFFGESPTFLPGEHGSTHLQGEEGPSHPIVENPSNFVAEQGPHIPNGGWQQHGGNAFGQR